VEKIKEDPPLMTNKDFLRRSTKICFSRHTLFRPTRSFQQEGELHVTSPQGFTTRSRSANIMVFKTQSDSMRRCYGSHGQPSSKSSAWRKFLTIFGLSAASDGNLRNTKSFLLTSTKENDFETSVSESQRKIGLIYLRMNGKLRYHWLWKQSTKVNACELND